MGRIQWNEGQLFPVCSAIVTNDEACTPEDGFQFYNGRAGIEGLIEEGKNGFSWDHLSHKSFEANATEFQLFLLAVQIVQLLRRLSLPNTKPPIGKNKRKSLPTIQTIRQRLIFIAGRLIRSARKLIFKCFQARSILFANAFSLIFKYYRSQVIRLEKISEIND